MVCLARRAGKALIRSGERGKGGVAGSKKLGAVCADRLVENQTTRASSIFTGAVVR